MNEFDSIEADGHDDSIEYNPLLYGMWERILEVRNRHIGCCVPGPTSE